jgi:hypothetical protein
MSACMCKRWIEKVFQITQILVSRTLYRGKATRSLDGRVKCRDEVQQYSCTYKHVSSNSEPIVSPFIPQLVGSSASWLS